MKIRLSKSISGAVAVVLLAATLAGCGGGVTNGQTTPASATSSPSTAPSTSANTQKVVVAISTEPESGFDPILGWGHGTTPLVQSTLVEYTQDMQIVNDLATDYTLSEDALVWTFTLREDAFFTDGTPVTAEDVAFTINKAKESQTSLDLSFIKDCVTKGTNQVEFTLSAPTSPFLNILASVGIVPKHAYTEDYAENPIGSGPWKLAQWNKGEQIILEANEEYYGNVPLIKEVVLVFMDEDAAFAAAQAGKVDVALTSATHATKEIPGMQIKSISTLDNRGMTMPLSPAKGNTTESGYPIGNDVTSDPAIRKALACGIDREQIAADAVNGYADPCYSENDGMPWNNPEDKIETDLAKAKNILEEAGWVDTDGDGILEKNGVKAEFPLIYPSGDSVRQAIGMAAAQQAKNLGISIQVEGISWDEISKRMFSEAVLMGWGSTNPYTSYSLYHSDNKLRDDYYNPEGLDNPVVDGYLEKAMQALTEEEAYQYWQKAQWDGTTGTSMQGDCPWVWLVNIQHLYYVRDGLDIGQQQLHAHGASWPLVQNLRDWTWQ